MVLQILPNSWELLDHLYTVLTEYSRVANPGKL